MMHYAVHAAKARPVHERVMTAAYPQEMDGSPDEKQPGCAGHADSIVGVEGHTDGSGSGDKAVFFVSMKVWLVPF